MKRRVRRPSDGLKHAPDCPRGDPDIGHIDPCTCGLSDKRAAAKAAAASASGELTQEMRDAIGLLGSAFLGVMSKPKGEPLDKTLSIEASAGAAQLLVRRAVADGRSVCLLIEEKKGEELKPVITHGERAEGVRAHLKLVQLARQAALCIRSAAHIIQQDLDEDDLDGENEGARDLAREIETALLEAGIAPIELADYLLEDEERDQRNKKARAS